MPAPKPLGSSPILPPSRVRASLRLGSYAVVAAAVMVVRWLAGGSGWHSSAELHTLLEALAALIAVMVAALAILRYRARKTTALLLAGVAFGGTAVLDAAHTAITSTFLLGYSGALPEGTVPWSWFLARFYLAVMLAFRGWAWSRADAHLPSTHRVLATGTALAGLLVAALLCMPLPRPELPEQLVSRPQELVPALLLVYAIFEHLRAGAWKEDPFEHSLLLSMILTFAAQALFMPFSRSAHDAMFDLAHILKLLSKGIVMSGLLAGTLHLFRLAELDYEDRTFGFLENLPVGVFITDAVGRPYYANKRAVALLGKGADFGVSPGELSSGYQAYVIGSDAEYPTDRMPIVRALKGEPSTVADMEIRRGDETLQLQVSGAPIVDRRGAVAYAIAAFQDIRELRRAAMEDPLTGLANRLSFHESYGRLAGYCWRTQQPVCVAIIDLDRFKSVNDNYGHDVGDQVLRRTAQLIMSAMRSTDVVARWGGEEIVVLLPGVTLPNAVLAIERALSRVRQEKFEARGASFSVTFSAGVALVENGATPERAVAAADRHLYQAKASGRNRVIAAEGPERSVETGT